MIAVYVARVITLISAVLCLLAFLGEKKVHHKSILGFYSSAMFLIFFLSFVIIK